VGWGYHVPNIVKHEGFELSAVVDPVEERLKEAREEHGARGHTDLASLLDSEALDLVVLASPTHLHLEQAVAAFEAGRDVFCDKPMAPSLRQADEMIAAAEAAGRKLMVYQPQRASQIVVSLGEVLDRGLIGPVYMIKAARSSYARRNDWQAFKKHGGGMLNNYGAHLIDALLHLSGSRARKLSCVMNRVASLGDADDVVKALIETENGVTLDVDINMASAQPLPAWHVLGKHGSVLFDPGVQGWKVCHYRPEELEGVSVDEGLAAPDRKYGSGERIPWQEVSFPVSDSVGVDYYTKCYEYFALDGEPYIPIAESRELMRVLQALRDDAGWS